MASTWRTSPACNNGAHDRYGRDSCMLCLGITVIGIRNTHNSEDPLTCAYYCDNNITSHVVRFTHRTSDALIVHDDNTKADRARVILDHLQRQKFNTLPWSAMPSDLSPIEYLWVSCVERCNQWLWHSVIHNYIHSFIHSFIHSSIHPYIHTYIYIYIHKNGQTNGRTNRDYRSLSEHYITMKNVLCAL